jgi:hypothetical protein
MASKNILKTMAAIALGKVMTESIGATEQIIFDNAWDAWGFYPDIKDIAIITGWLNSFEREIWHGAEQDAHTNLSFAIAILERQTGFLRGRKRYVINRIIDVLQELYDGLPPPVVDEYACNAEAAIAFDIWDKIVG